MYGAGSIGHPPDPELDSRYSWTRLALSMVLGTIGGVGLWSFVVALPSVQAEFGATRAGASIAYSMLTIGFGLGGVVMGRITDRHGFAAAAAIGAAVLGAGYIAAAFSAALWQVAVIHGTLIGFGSAATFGPLIADISHWFRRRRGAAVALAASGNYFAGAFWPPVIQHFISSDGWRATHAGIGLFCLAAMLPLILLLRRRRASPDTDFAGRLPGNGSTLGLRPNVLMALICLAGIACCVAMSMPQVHIVAYCGDLGYGVARGAEMLSLMLGFGIVSRILFGFVADRFGGLRTLLLSSSLQAVALVFYLFFDGLASLYVISAMFGLFQGGIVPSYAIIVREHFPPGEAGSRVGLAIMATLFGMSLGGWMSGYIFDLTGSYAAAFANGLAWNLLNMSIAALLLWRPWIRRALV